ncbi:hypothetical protein SynBIOSE41_02427 [Synechococcus sp. BIOS-E4-1]|nr:hypothetical protein SynBIOSE41_02427 [Synechococcus sp. BIOS-E4-1]
MIRRNSTVGTNQAATKRSISAEAGGTTTGTTTIKHQQELATGPESSDEYSL